MSWLLLPAFDKQLQDREKLPKDFHLKAESRYGQSSCPEASHQNWAGEGDEVRTRWKLFQKSFISKSLVQSLPLCHSFLISPERVKQKFPGLKDVHPCCGYRYNMRPECFMQTHLSPFLPFRPWNTDGQTQSAARGWKDSLWRILRAQEESS